MAKGDLTRHFGTALAERLARLLASRQPDLDTGALTALGPRLDKASLMQRVRIIAEALLAILPDDGPAAWKIIEAILPAPLEPDGKVFNDGYWMLPLAAYWELRGQADDAAFAALEELTQRGTAEFAIRSLIAGDPEGSLARIRRWVGHPSFHVRRLASEGTRPYLPWGGKLRVSRDVQGEFLRLITPLAGDPSVYVRKSVGNHVRDWRRIDPSVADAWIQKVDPAPDVRKLALPRNRR
jgi:3-methyladenine DNA glycosylase AlkC